MIEKRKDDHIRISLEEDVQASYDHWDDVYLPHRALPAIDLDDVSLGTVLLGRKLDAPLVISSMTGGSPSARKYNELLARAASEFGIAMGIGSQRAGIEKKEHRGSYEVVKDFDIPLLLGNLGAPQFSGTDKDGRYGIEEVRAALDMIDADGMFIHFNYLQEVVQPEGETRITGAIESLKDIAREFDLVAKETGAGISKKDAMMIKAAGFKAIDVGGMGGTSFAAVELHREDPHGRSKRIGETLWNWGIPAPVSLIEANVGLPLIGSGGLRNGLDVARALGLGATAGGMAWRLLKAASGGYVSLEIEISRIIEEVRSVIFLCGATSPEDMKGIGTVIVGRTREILQMSGRP